MTDRELMQMALRALKNAYSFIPMKMMERHLQAENALRDRLAQPEPEPVKWYSLAGTKREWFEGTVEATFAVGNNHTVYVSTDEEVKDIALNYIPKPKREWVGLTRTEAEDVVDNFITIGGDVEDWVGYCRAIEAKLKEKNT